jgi:uncharacterized membrane protein YjgN (DUF898 family)
MNGSMTEATLQPQPQTGYENLSFEFIKRPGLLKITIVNFLLGIITLGFYRFWGKTSVRKHIWSSVHLNGEPLEYAGTGMELFKGFMVILFAIFMPYAILLTAVSLIKGPESPWIITLQVAGLLVVQVFWGYALYKARKFQLSRTNWRGIRGTLIGSPMTYSLTYFGALLAKIFSLGWATPVMNTLLQKQIIGDMRFGDAAFKFKGPAGPLYPTYAMCWFASFAVILAVVSALSYGFLGLDFSVLEKLVEGANPSDTGFDQVELKRWVKLIMVSLAALFIVFMLVIPMLWAVYSAKELRTFANYTRFDGAQFSLDATAGSIIWLTIINLLIIILTLGIGKPFVQRRLVKFLVDRITLAGKIDVDRIAQSQTRMDSRGEGLADAFDVGGM